MRRLRTLVRIALALVVGLPVVVCVGLFLSIFASFPPRQGDRIVDRDVVGVETGGSYAWMVPTATGVVLIDAGLDPEATHLREVVSDRTVHAVLLTHGHVDHVAGLAAFPGVPVHAGPGEAALVRGEVVPQALMPRVVGERLGRRPDPPPEVEEHDGGTVLEIDGARFTVVHVPGHTGGSVAYLWKDVLFAGDALWGLGDRVAPAHWAFADDPAASRRALRNLLPFPFRRLADGHAGLHQDVRGQLEAYLGVEPPDHASQ